MKKQKDRALDVPAEANRDKHINYLEEAEKRSGAATKDSNAFKKRMRTGMQKNEKR